MKARNPILEREIELGIEDFGSAIQKPHDEVWYEFTPS